MGAAVRTALYAFSLALSSVLAVTLMQRTLSGARVPHETSSYPTTSSAASCGPNAPAARGRRPPPTAAHSPAPTAARRWSTPAGLGAGGIGGGWWRWWRTQTPPPGGVSLGTLWLRG